MITFIEVVLVSLTCLVFITVTAYVADCLERRAYESRRRHSDEYDEGWDEDSVL